MQHVTGFAQQQKKRNPPLFEQPQVKPLCRRRPGIAQGSGFGGQPGERGVRPGKLCQCHRIRLGGYEGQSARRGQPLPPAPGGEKVQPGAEAGLGDHQMVPGGGKRIKAHTVRKNILAFRQTVFGIVIHVAESVRHRRRPFPSETRRCQGGRADRRVIPFVCRFVHALTGDLLTPCFTYPCGLRYLRA